ACIADGAVRQLHVGFGIPHVLLDKFDEGSRLGHVGVSLAISRSKCAGGVSNPGIREFPRQIRGPNPSEMAAGGLWSPGCPGTGGLRPGDSEGSRRVRKTGGLYRVGGIWSGSPVTNPSYWISPTVASDTASRKDSLVLGRNFISAAVRSSNKV